MVRRAIQENKGIQETGDLSDRQKDVLRIVVSTHIESAAPIGSRVVSRSLGLSSATIRNVMMDLEEMGYISHPHTSAGRLPTDSGYRMYVDFLLEPYELTAQQEDFIRDFYARNIEDPFEGKMARTISALAILTRQTGLLFVPGLHLYVEGMSHMLNMPEFSDVAKLRIILRTLEEKTKLLELLNDDLETDGVNVHIGTENIYDELSDLTIIDTSYDLDGSKKGLIGIIGPKRMSYAKLIPVLQYMADVLNEIVSEES